MTNNNDNAPVTAAEWAQRMERGAMDEEAMHAFEAWLSASPTNGEDFQDAQSAWMATIVPDDALEAVLALAPDPIPEPKPLLKWLTRLQALWSDIPFQPHGIYASAVLLFAIGVAYVGALPRGHGPLEVVVTGIGQSQSLALPDGSVIELNTRTRLGYAYSSTSRTVELYEGEAFFDVEPDRDRPFEIAVGGSVVRVLGTSFNVKFVNDRFELAVTEGLVTVETANRSEGFQVTQGGYVQTGAAGQVLIRDRDPWLEMAWREGAIAFENESLRDVLDELDRYFQESLSVSEQYSGERFTGVIFINDVHEALEQLSAISSTEIKLDATGDITIRDD